MKNIQIYIIIAIVLLFFYNMPNNEQFSLFRPYGRWNYPRWNYPRYYRNYYPYSNRRLPFTKRNCRRLFPCDD